MPEHQSRWADLLQKDNKSTIEFHVNKFKESYQDESTHKTYWLHDSKKSHGNSEDRGRSTPPGWHSSASFLLHSGTKRVQLTAGPTPSKLQASLSGHIRGGTASDFQTDFNFTFLQVYLICRDMGPLRLVAVCGSIQWEKINAGNSSWLLGWQCWQAGDNLLWTGIMSHSSQNEGRW